MVLENVKEMWTEQPKTGKGKKKVRILPILLMLLLYLLMRVLYL